MRPDYPTRRSPFLHGTAACLLAFAAFRASALHADDDVADLLGNARPAATAPAPVTAPDPLPLSPQPSQPGAQAPASARPALILLSDGTRIEAPAWTTLQTPLRLWVEEDRRYHDIDLDLIARIDVRVLKEGLEDDWRWLKEGSDIKVFSGKKYPNVELAYRFTLLNGQVVEGGVVAPLYITSAGRVRTLALYKKFKGSLDQSLKDLIYIREVRFQPPVAAPPPAAASTRKLPLLE